MHIAEGFLPPTQAAAWTVVAAPFVVHGPALSFAKFAKTPTVVYYYSALQARSPSWCRQPNWSVTGSSIGDSAHPCLSRSFEFLRTSRPLACGPTDIRRSCDRHGSIVTGYSSMRRLSAVLGRCVCEV